jgi:hypothetical protein
MIDPFKFIPRVDQRGEITSWGLTEIYDDFFSLHMKRMKMQLSCKDSNPGGNFENYENEPAVQFINCLAYRKEIEIIKYRLSKSNNLPRDYILEISLRDISPRVWRRIKVSSGTKLSIFQDKVLCPALGWTRNYHGYYFTDSRDGSQFGPKHSNAIDFMQLPLHGFTLINDSKFTLGDILRNKRDLIYFTYDLGDNFEHVIQLIEIRTLENSNGKVELLGGEMAPLPEDSIGSPEYRGNRGYQDLLELWQKASSKKRILISTTVLESINYLTKTSFDPFEFDIAEAQAELRSAFQSRGSVRSGSKIICYPIGNQRAPLGLSIKRVGNIKEIITPLNHGKSILKESLSSKRDSKCNALCYNCGNPNNLRSCGSCRMVWYCGEVICG